MKLEDRDPDTYDTPDKADERREKEALRIWLRPRQPRHFHEIIREGDDARRGYQQHWTKPAEQPDQVHPTERDTELGPAEVEVPKALADYQATVGERILADLRAYPTPPHMLSIWRLRLFCGHLVERTAHKEHDNRGWLTTFYPVPCRECGGIEPMVVIAGKRLGPAGLDPRAAKAARASNRIAKIADELAAAERRIEQLRREAARLGHVAGRGVADEPASTT